MRNIFEKRGSTVLQERPPSLESHRPFERPHTALNGIVERLARIFPKRLILGSDIECCLTESVRSFATLGADPLVLRRVQTETQWNIREASAPRDVWCGEATFAVNGNPVVSFFQDSVTTHLPGQKLFGIALQCGVDHMVGHLYPYYCGREDYGEHVACRLQYFAVSTRQSMSWRFVSGLLKLIYWRHKLIPFSNYAQKAEL